MLSAQQTVAVNDFGFISPSGAVLGTDVVMSSNSRLLNLGTAFGASGALFISSFNLSVENHGSLTGSGALGVIQSFGATDWTGTLAIRNHGTITTTGSGTTATVMTGTGGLNLTNTGTISAVFNTAIALCDTVAGHLGGTNGIVNSGLIDGRSLGAIQAHGATGDRVTNSGTIHGLIDPGGGTNSLTNSGEIFGEVQPGGLVGSVTNTGILHGDLSFFNGANTVLNTGTITGSVEILGTTGLFQSTGTAMGLLTGSSEMSWVISGLLNDGINDIGLATTTCDLRGATILGSVLDHGGADFYLVDSADINIVDPGGEQDAVFAWCSYALGSGLETLTLNGAALNGTGNELGNTIEGTAAGNLLDGGLGDDIQSGFSERDTRWGETGNDTLQGGAQSDRLEGGTGAGSLTGGADADIFVLSALSDNGLTNPTRDLIPDFTSGSDRIDLSGIDAIRDVAGDQAFNSGVLKGGTPGRLILRIHAAPAIWRAMSPATEWRISRSGSMG